jgi:hypothetical protein
MAGDVAQKSKYVLKVGEKKVTILQPMTLMTSASAEQMATALQEFATKLNDVAAWLQQQRKKEEVCRVTIFLLDDCDPSSIAYKTRDCNGGGDE